MTTPHAFRCFLIGCISHVRDLRVGTHTLHGLEMIGIAGRTRSRTLLCSFVLHQIVPLCLRCTSRRLPPVSRSRAHERLWVGKKNGKNSLEQPNVINNIERCFFPVCGVLLRRLLRRLAVTAVARCMDHDSLQQFALHGAGRLFRRDHGSGRHSVTSIRPPLVFLLFSNFRKLSDTFRQTILCMCNPRVCTTTYTVFTTKL